MGLYKNRNRGNRSYYSGHQKLNLIIKEGSGGKALKWMAVIASISALIISALAYVYSIESTKLSNRPYIVAPNLRQHFRFDLKNISESPNFDAIVKIQNVGQTPAFHLIIKSAINIYGKEFSSNPDFLDYPGKDIILPNGSYYNIELNNNREFNSQEIDDVREKKKFFYDYGELSYTDIFDDHHITKFCFRLEDSSIGEWNFYDKWNEMN